MLTHIRCSPNINYNHNVMYVDSRNGMKLYEQLSVDVGYNNIMCSQLCVTMIVYILVISKRTNSYSLLNEVTCKSALVNAFSHSHAL